MHGRVLIISLPHGGEAPILSFLEALGFWRWEADRSQAPVVASNQLGRAGGIPRGVNHTQSGGGPVDVSAGLATPVAEAERVLAAFAAMPEGTYAHAHLAYHADVHRAAEAARIPIVFVYRDPRACFASMLCPPAGSTPIASFREEELITRLADRLAAFRGWLTAEGVLACRYEGVVGPGAGGTATGRIEALVGLADHVGWRGRVSSLLDAFCQTMDRPAGRDRRDGRGAAATGQSVTGASSQLTDLASAWGYVGDADVPGRHAGDAGLLWLLDGLQRELSALATDRRQLIGEALDRGEAVRRLEQRVASLAVDAKHHAAESTERLAAIRRLEGVVRRLESQLAEARALSDHYARDGDARLQVIRRLEARLAQVAAAR